MACFDHSVHNNVALIVDLSDPGLTIIEQSNTNVRAKKQLTIA
jgi:hypothetical protein